MAVRIDTLGLVFRTVEAAMEALVRLGEARTAEKLAEKGGDAL